MWLSSDLRERGAGAEHGLVALRRGSATAERIENPPVGAHCVVNVRDVARPVEPRAKQVAGVTVWRLHLEATCGVARLDAIAV